MKEIQKGDVLWQALILLLEVEEVVQVGKKVMEAAMMEKNLPHLQLTNKERSV